MGHNSGDSIGGSSGLPAGSGVVNKRHRGSPRNPAKNPAGQLRSNSAETQMHSNKPRLVCFLLLGFQLLLKQALQGCGLREVTGSPKVPNREILIAQNLSMYTKIKFFWLPKGKSQCPVVPGHFQNMALHLLNCGQLSFP